MKLNLAMKMVCTSVLMVWFAACALAQPVAGGSSAAVERVGSAVSPVSPVSPARESATTAVTPVTQAASPGSTLSTEILIGPGDLLQVTVFGAPDYDKQVRVSAEGTVFLPLAGSVKVGGLTTEQASAVIASKLSDGGYFNDPKVSVLEKEFSTQGISVLGEVQKPGIYPLPGTRNLFDALSAAGGTTPRAGTLVAITHRSDPQHPQAVSISYDGKSGTHSNIPIYPGDTVVVSKAGLVYVTGDVKTPGGFIMENAHMTVLQAVAMAQGVNPTAKLDHAQLIRNPGQGAKQQEITIQLKKILSAKAADINMQPNDILFVPSSAMKSAGRRTLDSIVQVATGMAIVARY
jgi:polysaccharide export outer membrane protein